MLDVLLKIFGPDYCIDMRSVYFKPVSSHGFAIALRSYETTLKRYISPIYSVDLKIR